MGEGPLESQRSATRDTRLLATKYDSFVRHIWDGYLLYHYLDDFQTLGPYQVQWRAITARVVRALEEVGSFVVAISTLNLVTDIFF